MERTSRQVTRGKNAFRIIVAMAVMALVAAALSGRGERASETETETQTQTQTRRAAAERALVPLGIDNTYNNFDVWIPTACRDASWTGFTFQSNQPLTCFGALYDGMANPFASPTSGAAGIPGTIASATVGTIIDWTNTAAPVAWGGGATRDGHFGYQFLTSSPTVGCTNAMPSARWHRMGGRITCGLSETEIVLVAPVGSHGSESSAGAAQPPNAEIKVINHSSKRLSISLAARDWPDGEGYEAAGIDLLSRLRPEDVLFATHFDGVPIVTEALDPGGQVTYPLTIPPGETVALAWHSVSALDPEEEEEYAVYTAFESRTELIPLDTPTPVDEPTPDPTDSTSTPTPTASTPTPGTPPWIGPIGLYFPVAVLNLAWGP